MRSTPVIRFADFELDLAAGELRKRGRRVKLAPQPFRLLALLASSPGQLLTRDALQAQLWEEGTFVDFEHALNFYVREVRGALRDTARRPRLIETLPKRGYRFIGMPTAEYDSHETQEFSLRKEEEPRNTGSDAESVSAHEHYSRGRKQFQELGKGSLEAAKTHFQIAIGLDPQYAMAHSGLGATHAMRYVHRSDQRDLEAAQTHLERAIELDPELPEPYPWLCYVYMRCGDLQKSLAMGQRGVVLLPGLVHTHYFLGAAFNTVCESDARAYPEAVKHLLRATEIDPRWMPSWFILSQIYLWNGRYGEAEEFGRRLLAANSDQPGVTRLPGGENLLAAVSLRRGDFESARACFTQSFKSLLNSDHMYADAMRAAAAYGMGDVELRVGRAEAALAQYRLAWQIVQEYPTMMAHGRHAARALAGMAAAYAAEGQREHAAALLLQAEAGLATCSGPQTSSAFANLGELRYAFAVAHLRAGNIEQAIQYLFRAVDGGWCDVAWLERDPELTTLKERTEFRELVQQVQSTGLPEVSVSTTENEFAKQPTAAPM